ncbi:MAG: hypothetical protein M3256_12755 [Actinomycetota bacterium]|nr:hypothetical protein [Actinomycetota bacterium]
MTEPESHRAHDKDRREKVKPLHAITTGFAASAETREALAASAEALNAMTMNAETREALAASAEALNAMTLNAETREALAASAQALNAMTLNAETREALAASMKSLKAFADVPLMSVKLPAMDVGRIDQLVSAISLAKFPTWALDQSLIRSGIDTATIHTPAFTPTPPAVKPSPSQAESAQRRLLDAFDSLLKFEFEMRELISKRLSAVAGSRWWKQRVPGGVLEECQTRKDEKERPGSGVSHHPIYYAYPDDYRKIILRQDNWDECFEQVFTHKIEVDALFLWIGAARPEIAHARPLDDAIFTKFTTSVRWIVNAIESAEGCSAR